MADTSLPNLTGLASVAGTDLFYVVDISDTSDGDAGTSKKVTKDVLFTSPTLTTPEVDTINESTADNGVVIDSLKIKDAGFAVGSDADGDIYYRSSGALERLAKGTASQVLKMNSGATAPEWVTLATTDDGWVDPDDTWTYASATTITVPAGAALIYSKGDRIRLKQGGAYKYWVLATVANALLTIIETDDYTLTNDTITDNYYSHADKPVGFPNKFTWTTAYTGFSSDPTGKIEYTVSGGRITINLVSGTGTSNNAAFDFTLPVAEAFSTAGWHSVPACVYDNGSWQAGMGIVGVDASVGKVGINGSTLAVNAFAGFTASGNKAVVCEISYPI